MTQRKRSAPPAPDHAFRSALADVTPLRPRNKVELTSARPKPRPKPRPAVLSAPADDLSDYFPPGLALDAGGALKHARPGVQTQALRQLRRRPVEDELDLHGLTVSDARALLVGFLARCNRNGIRCVRIIHGKGLRSPNREPVLKAKVAGWLAQRNDVLAFREAAPNEGGSGAVVVLLKAGS
jgi:DNA-nicking Smr family endonuclease